MGTCIANVFSSITNKMQIYISYLFLWNALYVSGGSPPIIRSSKTVYTASGTLSNLYCYLPLSWQVAVKVWQSIRCCIYSFWPPDDGRKNRLKHVEHFTEINKLCNNNSYMSIRHTVSQSVTTLLYLHWIQLHVSALGMGHHQIVLRHIE
jgi:hypothetical protein